MKNLILQLGVSYDGRATYSFNGLAPPLNIDEQLKIKLCPSLARPGHTCHPICLKICTGLN